MVRKRIDSWHIHWSEWLHSRFGEACGLSEVICLMRLPWQLRATQREMTAVLPKPTLPTITTPWLAEDSLLRRHTSTSWNSHSRPVKTASGVRLGTSKRSGFRAMSGGRYGAKRTASWETLGNVVNETGFIQTYTCILYIYLILFLQRCYPSNRKLYSSISKWKPLHNATIIFNQQREMLFSGKGQNW